jgi:23S rRNA (adenine1618-N6)-methyltransferase
MQHPRNKHQGRYDFEALVSAHPPLAQFVIGNKHQPNEKTIDFANAESVLALNTALLSAFYGIKNWDIPEGYLCPPIPSRAEYLHHLADLLAQANKGVVPQGPQIRCLDIGVGANCIYPIVGTKEYDWTFVGVDVDKAALDNAQNILNNNPELNERITLRFQPQSKMIFRGIIKTEELFDLTICNPPFHNSLEEAEEGSLRKTKNLTNRANLSLNFGGKKHELCYEGGEKAFLTNMIQESRYFAQNCTWFSSLVSKEEHLALIYKLLKAAKATKIKTLDLSIGNKKSRAVAWSFKG